MPTKRALNELLLSFQKDLSASGFSLEAIIFYCSYAKGNVHKYSDIDIAV
jgi:predicted nucleotidyltransferase